MVNSRMVTICRVLPGTLVEVSIEIIELIREEGTASQTSRWVWFVFSDGPDSLPHASGVRFVVEVLLGAKVVRMFSLPNSLFMFDLDAL